MGAGAEGGSDDGDGLQWLVGERVSIADIAVADLVRRCGVFAATLLCSLACACLAASWSANGCAAVTRAAPRQVDMHLSQPAFEGDVRSTFPHLMMHHKRVFGQPGVWGAACIGGADDPRAWLTAWCMPAAAGIKEYLASCNRHSLVWGQEWIDLQRQDGGGCDGGS